MIQGGIRPISCKLFVRSSKSTQPGPCHRSRIPSYMQNPSRMPVGSPAPDPLLSGDLGARAHRVIGSMLRTLLVVLPVVFLATFLSSARTESIAVGTLLVALACVAWLHSRARLVVTICALVGILVAYGIAGAITFGSIRSAAVLAFVGSVIVGGIFLDRRGLAALFALNVTALGALVYAENAGWLVQPHYTVGFLHWLVHAAVIGAVAGYLALWVVFWSYKLATGKDGMGYGDFKLLAAIGAWLGWKMLPVVILLSSFVGAIVGISLIVFARHGRNVPIPFGPYLVLAGLIALFWGEPLLQYYLHNL